MINDYTVDARVEGTSIKALVCPYGDLPEGVRFAFYLLRDDEPVIRLPYSSKKSCTFELTEASTYVVKAFAYDGQTKISKRSESLEYAYELTNNNTLPAELPYTALAFPHGDLAIISAQSDHMPNSRSVVASVAAESDLMCETFTSDRGKSHVIFAEHIHLGTSPRYFSGVASKAGRFIFGADDLSENCDIPHEEVGDYCTAEWRESRILLQTDYFGVGKVYYYSGHGFACASNRSHLLLRVLQQMGVRLELDKQALRATLSATTQVFSQSFTDRIGIAGVHALLPGQMLELQNGDLHIQRTDLSEVLDEETNQVVNEEQYQRSIEAGAQEIVSNLRGAVDHRRFRRVRVDVTGGLDSRTLVAALARVETHGKKVELHTADFTTAPHELPISLRLSREIRLPYDTGPRRTYEVDADKALLENISFHLGSYFGNSATPLRTQLPDTLCINGFYGEASLRPYFARLIYSKGNPPTDCDDFVRSHVRSMASERKVLTGDEDLISTFREHLEGMPGTSVAAKFDSLYLFHRNGLHCSDRWLCHVRAPSWGPLQSKSLFALKWKTLDTFQNIKIQLDVTESLDANLARVPVGRASDNSERALISASYPPKLDVSDHVLGISESDRRRFQEAGRARAKNSTFTKFDDSDPRRRRNDTSKNRHRAWIMSAIGELESKYHVLSGSEAVELSTFVDREYGRSGQKIRPAGSVITGKILSVVFMCRFTQRSHMSAFSPSVNKGAREPA